MCTDDLHRQGLWPAPLADSTIRAVARHLPPYIVPQNPVDLVSVPMNDPAATAFPAFGRLVAVKIDNNAIAHKTEMGLVRLNVASAEDCACACREVLENAARQVPSAQPRGVLLAEMMAGGLEAIIGVQRDPVPGPFVAVGLGGIFVEVMRDVVFHAAPVDHAGAHDMLRRLRAWPLLEGGRAACLKTSTPWRTRSRPSRRSRLAHRRPGRSTSTRSSSMRRAKAWPWLMRWCGPAGIDKGLRPLLPAERRPATMHEDHPCPGSPSLMS